MACLNNLGMTGFTGGKGTKIRGIANNFVAHVGMPFATTLVEAQTEAGGFPVAKCRIGFVYSRSTTCFSNKPLGSVGASMDHGKKENHE
jgi:hypothetical protein